MMWQEGESQRKGMGTLETGNIQHIQSMNFYNITLIQMDENGFREFQNNNLKCTEISVPYSEWGGEEGEESILTHYVGCNSWSSYLY